MIVGSACIMAVVSIRTLSVLTLTPMLFRTGKMRPSLQLILTKSTVLTQAHSAMIILELIMIPTMCTYSQGSLTMLVSDALSLWIQKARILT